MSSAISEELRGTVVANWHGRLSANTSTRRNHYRTKVLYFQSVAVLLAEAPAEPLTWRSIVDAAAPRGRRSTFYEVTGAHARHRMVGDLISDGRLNSIQIALHYNRSDAVAQLVDETKVWSYWPYREGLIARLARTANPDAGEKALIEALLRWSQLHPQLTAALDYTPPACAVEDLTVVLGGRLAALRAARLLTDVLRNAARSSADEQRIHGIRSDRVPG